MGHAWFMRSGRLARLGYGKARDLARLVALVAAWRKSPFLPKQANRTVLGDCLLARVHHPETSSV